MANILPLDNDGRFDYVGESYCRNCRGRTARFWREETKELFCGTCGQETPHPRARLSLVERARLASFRHAYESTTGIDLAARRAAGVRPV